MQVRRAKAKNQMSRYLTNFNPFPATMVATLNYTQKIQLDSSAGAQLAPVHWFRANSIYDPDFTGVTGGGQPYGHDTYAGIYNHYKVLSSIITVQCQSWPESATTLNGVGVLLNDDTTISTSEDSAKQLCARKGSSWKVGARFGERASISRKFDSKYFVNKNHQCAPFGNNPSEGFFFGVFALEDNLDVKTMAMVNIVYTVKMWELKDLSAV